MAPSATDVPGCRWARHAALLSLNEWARLACMPRSFNLLAAVALVNSVEYSRHAMDLPQMGGRAPSQGLSDGAASPAELGVHTAPRRASGQGRRDHRERRPQGLTLTGSRKVLHPSRLGGRAGPSQRVAHGACGRAPREAQGGHSLSACKRLGCWRSSWPQLGSSFRRNCGNCTAIMRSQTIRKGVRQLGRRSRRLLHREPALRTG